MVVAEEDSLPIRLAVLPNWAANLRLTSACLACSSACFLSSNCFLVSVGEVVFLVTSFVFTSIFLGFRSLLGSRDSTSVLIFGGSILGGSGFGCSFSGSGSCLGSGAG